MFTIKNILTVIHLILSNLSVSLDDILRSQQPNALSIPNHLVLVDDLWIKEKREKQLERSSVADIERRQSDRYRREMDNEDLSIERRLVFKTILVAQFEMISTTNIVELAKCNKPCPWQSAEACKECPSRL